MAVRCIPAGCGQPAELEATVAETVELIRQKATASASCINKKALADAVYLESCYLYVHLISRLLFAKHGLIYRNCFVLPLFVCLANAIYTDQIGGKTKEELFAAMNSREMYYSRYPCCDDEEWDFSFIFQAFAELLSEYVEDSRYSYRIEMMVYTGFQHIMIKVNHLRYGGNVKKDH